MFKKYVWFGFGSTAIDQPHWRICRNTATHLAGLYENTKDALLLPLVWPHIFSYRGLLFGPWASPSCRIKLLNTPAGHWRCQRMRCSQLQWVCLYRGGIQRLLLSFVSLSMKWLMRMCVMWWFSFPSPDQMAERKGWLGDNAPKYEQLNINRNAICCSATNTHRDRGNKGNGYNGKMDLHFEIC